MCDKWLQFMHSLSLLHHASSLLWDFKQVGHYLESGALCTPLIASEALLLMAVSLARDLVKNIVAFVLAPPLGITVTSLFLRKEKPRKSLSCEALIKINTCGRPIGEAALRRRGIKVLETGHSWPASRGRLGLPWQVSDKEESTCSAGDVCVLLDREDPLEKEIATHSNILTWKISWTEDPGGLQSVVLPSWRWLRN